jgi:hypothetical protein
MAESQGFNAINHLVKPAVRLGLLYSYRTARQYLKDKSDLRSDTQLEHLWDAFTKFERDTAQDYPQYSEDLKKAKVVLISIIQRDGFFREQFFKFIRTLKQEDIKEQ